MPVTKNNVHKTAITRISHNVIGKYVRSDDSMTTSPLVPSLGVKIPIMTLQPYPGDPRSAG